MSIIPQKLVSALEKTCKYLGHKNDPVIAVAVIASFKGILRPLFTLQNKHQSKEQTHYAALRDFLTELIAIPSYIILSHLTKGAFAGKLAVPGNERNARKVLSFLGICGTAFFVIPTLCNLALGPIMDKYFKPKSSEPAKESVPKCLDFVSRDERMPVVLTPRQMPKPLVNDNVKNVWNYYHLERPNGMKV